MNECIVVKYYLMANFDGIDKAFENVFKIFCVTNFMNLLHNITLYHCIIRAF